MADTLVLKTEVDIKQAEKDLEKFKKELQKYDEEAKKLIKQKAEIELKTNVEQEKTKLKDIQNEIKATASIIRELKKEANTENVSIETFTNLDIQKQKIIRLNDEYEKQRNKVIETNAEYEKQKPKLEEINEQIEKNKNTQENLNKTIQDATQKIEEAKNRSHGIGDGFEKGLKSLKKFALGLFGIRSAFSLLRRATNAYLSQNEATANKINAIWTALGNALAPVIEIIADGILKLIGYLQVFLNALGWKVDLTKNMNKNTKAVDGTTGAIKKQTKALKELENQTASFDEMNVVQKQSNADTGDYGGGGGVGGSIADAFKMPPLDPTIVQKLKDLAGWLKRNWDWIWKVGAALAGVFALAKLGKVLAGLAGLASGLSAIAAFLPVLLTIAALIAEIYGMFKFIQAMNAVSKMNNDVKKMVKGVTKVNDEVNKTNLETVLTYEKGSKAIDDYIYEQKDQIKHSKDVIKAKEKENKKMSLSDRILDSYGGTARKNKEIMREHALRIVENAENLQKLAKEGKLTDEQMEDYNDTLKFIKDNQNLLNNSTRNGIDVIIQSKDELVKRTDALLKNDEQMRNSAKEQKDLVGSVATVFKEKFGEINKLKAEPKVNTDKEKDKANTLFTTIKNKFNDLNKLKATPTVQMQVDTKKLSAVFDTLANTSFLGTSLTSSFATTASKLKSIGLARGGIVNLPGKGVRLSDIVVGEATGGQEGVVPLNNEESMSLIGQAVAKYVNINLTNNTMLDGKVIAREQRVISNNIDFATNGRGV